MKFNIVSFAALASAVVVVAAADAAAAAAIDDESSSASNNNLRSGSGYNNANNNGYNNANANQVDRYLQTIDDLEYFPGSCQNAVDVYDGSADIQLLFASSADFESECGVGGSCFSGGVGCCAISNAEGSEKAIPYVCETVVPRTYPFAVCICNEHTAPRGIVTPTTPAPTPVPPPTTPNPTAPPTLLSDNCQRYNPNSVEHYDDTISNPWENFGLPYITCFTNADCQNQGPQYEPGCCLPSMCVCTFASLVHGPGETVQCTG